MSTGYYFYVLFLVLVAGAFPPSSRAAISSLNCSSIFKISADRDLASVREMSTYETIYSPSYFIETPSSGYVWCARVGDAPRINNTTLYIDFEEEVLVERLLVHGNQPSYVSQFQLLYQKEGNGSFKQYGQTFTTSSPDFVTFYITPISAVSLQFAIQNVTLDNANNFCWHVDVFGCLKRDAVTSACTLAEKSITESSILPTTTSSFASSSPTLLMPSLALMSSSLSPRSESFNIHSLATTSEVPFTSTSYLAVTASSTASTALPCIDVEVTATTPAATQTLFIISMVALSASVIVACLAIITIVIAVSLGILRKRIADKAPYAIGQVKNPCYGNITLKATSDNSHVYDEVKL